MVLSIMQFGMLPTAQSGEFVELRVEENIFLDIHQVFG
jgi:hypothetical protein